MHHKTFLAYFADPFSSKEPMLAVMDERAERAHLISTDQLTTLESDSYTFNASYLIEALRVRNLHLPPLIDIRHALQLASGRSRANFERSDWSFDRWLRVTSLTANQQRAIKDWLSRGMVPKSFGEAETVLTRFCEAIRDVWNGVAQELTRLGELERFLRFEAPVQKLFHKRQAQGIPVDVPTSTELLANAKREKYQSMLRLGERLKINPGSLRYTTVLPLLKETDAGNLAELPLTKSLPSYFKLAAVHSQVARDCRTMLNANIHIKALLALATSGGRAFPMFDTFATVTGRIQTTNPNLQHVKRAYRKALQPENGNHSEYFDYSQFEPGILAQFVGPGPYRDLYNSGDVYASLAQAIFGDECKRDIAKIVFIAFCYGMELSSLGRLLGTYGKTDGWKYAAAVERFFLQFPELEEYRASCARLLAEQGQIATAFGNHRTRLHRGPLSRKEKGWAMNQTIQGTGALIFKDALISLAEKLGDDAILLPIHDAVWLQTPIDRFSPDAFRELVIADMKATFYRWCPDVNMQVRAHPWEKSQ